MTLVMRGLTDHVGRYAYYCIPAVAHTTAATTIITWPTHLPP